MASLESLWFAGLHAESSRDVHVPISWVVNVNFGWPFSMAVTRRLEMAVVRICRKWQCVASKSKLSMPSVSFPKKLTPVRMSNTTAA